MEVLKTESEEGRSRWKCSRQSQRKAVPGGSAQNSVRGRLFQVEVLETESEVGCSRWKCSRQESEEGRSRWKCSRQSQGKAFPRGSAKDRERGRLLLAEGPEKLPKTDEEGGDVAQLVEHRTGTPPTQVRCPDAARDFSPRVYFQCRLSYMCPYTLVCKRMH